MTSEKWTLLLVRDEHSPVQQYTVSPFAIRLAIGGAVSFFVVLAVLAVTVGVGSHARLRARQLATENGALVVELEDLRATVDRLGDDLDGLAEKDSRYRLLAGLGSIDAEVYQAGVGGPGGERLESHPLWTVDSTLSKQAFAVSYDLNAMERRTRLLSESLSEAIDSLQAHRDLLESTPSILPTDGVLSSRFSKARMHPIHHIPLPHEGIDVSASQGTPILAAASGRVVYSGRRNGYGLTVELDHGYGYETLYGHASKLLVRKGQTVKRGDVIALVGSTGLSTFSHLHYEVRVGGRPVNPLQYVLNGAIP